MITCNKKIYKKEIFEMKKLFFSLLVLAFLAVSLGGCKQEAQKEEVPTVVLSATESTLPTATESVPVKEPIKIGVVAPITGGNAEYGKAEDVSTEMAIEEINAAGGINGRLLVRELVDDKSDPTEATDLARRFVQDKEIMIVIGSFNSACSMAAAPIYEDAGLVQLSPSASNPDFPKMGQYQFAIIGRQTDESLFYANNIIKDYVHAKSVALIYVNDDWGKKAFTLTKTDLEDIGIKITAEESFVAGEKDFNAMLTKVKETNPDAIHLITMYNETSIMVNQIRQMGWDVPILVRDMAQQIITLTGNNANGLIGVGSFIVDESNPRVAAWAKEFESRAGFTPNQHAASPYDAVYIVAEALRKIGDDITRENLKNALELTDYAGLAGRIKFTDVHDVRRQYRILGIVDGVWVALSDYQSAGQ
jgi:branched-chain amino acid transport system substrate-binding protein